MTEQKIEPHKVTKPIQLLAAWLVGLVLTNASFLVAASRLGDGGWERGALIIASIVNVPLFLAALFILQTRFRAELQEDTYYSEYLTKKSASVVRVEKTTAQEAKIEALERSILRISHHADVEQAVDSTPSNSEPLDWSRWPVALNEAHPRFTEIREALRSAKIPLTTVFGSPERPPDRWTISLSNDLPVAHKVALLSTVLRFDFVGIIFWDPLREADEDEDVYIGGYGNDTYAAVTDELWELLKRDAEPVDFRIYFAKHLVPRKK
jgi:hypothetical protein